MSAARRLASIVISSIIMAAASPTRGQIAEADRFIKLGTRFPPLPPGEGGQLLVTAPQQFCTDANHELELGHLGPGSYQPILRVLTGPSSCQWDFEGLPAGDYRALIKVQRDDRVVATARGHVLRGATSLMALDAEQVEVEGQVSGPDGAPLANGGRLVFHVDGAQWDTPLNADGTYRVKLGGFNRDHEACVMLEPPQPEPLNAVSLKCGPLFPIPGLHHLNFDDVRIPPGLIRVEVPPLDGARFDAFAEISISSRAPGSTGFTVDPANPGLAGFKLIRGLRGEYFAEYREYQIVVTKPDRQTVLASSRVTVSSDHPIADVKLTVTAVR